MTKINLGYHWAMAREAGEPQLTFNFIKAFTDFINNFCFARGVTFKAPKATSAIIPSLLNRVWTVDNDRQALLWEAGQMAGVTGDCFIKIAYEEPQIWPPMPDPANPIPGVERTYLPGRVRILILNSSYSFPIWNPHDRTRLIQFTQKYRFWAPSVDGTRQMNIYTEVITDTEIREYVNDSLISEPRPNPLGFIPVVHIPNTIISGSPWGLADCHDILTLNRTYNETATSILDIVNYYSAPVTVISGSAPSSMVRGAANTWGVPKGVEVSNLEGGHAGIPGALKLLDYLKISMHEMVGVPEGALGQVQPISNTAGVAVALQYQPMMQRYDQKKVTFGKGLVDINTLILRTLAIKEPETAIWSPEADEELQPGQLGVLDWTDPITYRTEVHWPSPLPVDVMSKLAEIQTKMSLGLESKVGALSILDEEFPHDKSLEIFQELMSDALDQGALDMQKARISAAIVSETGMLPMDGSDIAVQSAGGPEVTPSGAGGSSGGASDTGAGPGRPQLPNQNGPDYRQVLAELNARAMGTKTGGTKLPSLND